MKDRVGTMVPSQSDVASLASQLEKVESEIKKFGISLTKDERLGSTKFRPGGERIVGLIAELATKHGLVLPGISISGMKADLDLAEALRPLQSAAERVLQLCADTVLEAQSECWWATTAYYTALCRMTAANPDLEAALSPAIKFFATGRRKKATDTPAQ